MLKFFKNNEVFKSKFKLIENEAIEIGEFLKEDKKEIILEKEEILSSMKELNLDSKIYSDFEKNKVIIKAFSFEGNLDIYKFLSNKKLEINKAIEVFRAVDNKVEIKMASELFIEGLESKAPSKEIIEFKEEVFINEYFSGKNKSNVLILDFVDFIYLGEAFLNGRARDYVYTSAFGSAIKGGKVLKVKIGTNLSDVFANLNGEKDSLNKIIDGGVVSGKVRVSLEEKIMGNEKSLLFLTKKDENRKKESACIRCSKCIRICPEKLNPTKLIELYKINDKKEFLKFGGAKCIKCGLCSFVCPSNIELSNKICTAKEIFKESEKNATEVRREQLV